MKADILTKLENLLNSENVLAAQKEFNQLSAQFKSLTAHGISKIDHHDDDEDDHEDDLHEDSVHESVGSAANTDGKVAVMSPPAPSRDGEAKIAVPDDKPVLEDSKPAQSETVESQSDDLGIPADGKEKNPLAAIDGLEQMANGQDEAPSKDGEASEALAKENNKDETSSENANTEDNAFKDALPSTKASESETPEKEAHNEGTDITAEIAKFKEIVAAFKQKTQEARDARKKLEEETVRTAKTLLEELRNLVQNEENIGKAFAGYNSIRDKWKALPKVSNDSYRDLNVDYNRIMEEFFYNINIYKELKELDLKHNLEQKLIVLEDQKKLENLNDIRLLEVEVRLNQDRWNEIGPTFKEEWDKIKDEFWNVTRNIYKRIQDFYNQRREEQEKNYLAKQELLERVQYLKGLQLKSHKKWQEKTQEIIDLQKQWKMIGFVPKENAGPLWREFRKVCDDFFEAKRSHYGEIRKQQDANRDAKEKLVAQAIALKDSENWKEASDALIQLQKDWKEIGAAHQRDENKLWRKFREACDHFFQSKKEKKSEEISEQKDNLIAKEAILEELTAFTPSGDRNSTIEELKNFAEKWRQVGHVPFKEKDRINKSFRNLMDEKYGALDMGRKEKEQIRFEQKLENFKEQDNNDYQIRKEEDHIRRELTKLQNELIQYENNIGFFSASKGAEKLKKDVERKIDKAKEEIDVLKDRLSMLRQVQ